jgi:hypothetical protein
MLALLSQGALLYTRLHVSLKWSAFLEALVLLHGATVAFAGQGSPLWTMFASGFGFMFVATQLWGLKLPRAANIVLVAAYAAAVIVLYSGALGGLIKYSGYRSPFMASCRYSSSLPPQWLGCRVACVPGARARPVRKPRPFSA